MNYWREEKRPIRQISLEKTLTVKKKIIIKTENLYLRNKL